MQRQALKDQFESLTLNSLEIVHESDKEQGAQEVQKVLPQKRYNSYWANGTQIFENQFEFDPDTSNLWNRIKFVLISAFLTVL